MKRSMICALLLFTGCAPIGDLHPTGAKEDRGDNPLGLRVTYDDRDGQVHVALGEPLTDGQQLYVRLRRGQWHQLDCAQLVQEVDPIDPADPVVPVDPSFTRSFYGPEWGEEPTADMIAKAEAGTDPIIDTCLVSGNEIQLAVETDFNLAWDLAHESASSHADTPDTAIHSVQKYGELCVRELGEIPFFKKLADGKYETYSCLDSTPIPMTQTAADGTVTNPDHSVDVCDKPQYIYSMCEPGPRVAHRVNDDGTHWVLLCRKSIGGYTSSEFNDIAMIGHNPFTGKTCFFQNALYSKRDGAHVPHPADVEKSENLWSGVHGGLGSGIECSHCHDNDPFIHSPWIDGAIKDAKTVVPKMGVDPDFQLGYNDAPYTLVNATAQGWTMEKQLVSPEAAACTKCHRFGGGRWMDWISRLDGTDSSFLSITTDEYKKFEKLHWMPTTLREENVTEANWGDSKFAKAIAFIKGCYENRERCLWKDVPKM